MHDFVHVLGKHERAAGYLGLNMLLNVFILFTSVLDAKSLTGETLHKTYCKKAFILADNHPIWQPQPGSLLLQQIRHYHSSQQNLTYG